jgi:DNA-directed RNA polymerase sigma subunit (sigma70/sigma32)
MAIQPRRDDEPRAERDRLSVGESAALRDLRRQARATPALKSGELDDMLRRSALGDQASRERIVAANLTLVIRHAETRQHRGLSLPDLILEGSLGLVEAVRTFSGGGADRFAGFAEEKIAAQIDAAIATEKAAVRDAQLMVTAATDYERTELLLWRELGRSPTAGEIAEKLEWTVDRTRYVAEVVAEARRRHDEELLAFIDPEAIDADPDEDIELDG